jgi:hypothetical protein
MNVKLTEVLADVTGAADARVPPGGRRVERRTGNFL